MTLVQQLVKKGILEKEKVASLEFEIKNSGRKEEEIILEKGITSENFLFSLKSENLKIPLKEVVAEEVPLNILEFIPEESARYYKMVPLAKKDNLLEVGMVYPEDLKTQEALQFLARRNKFAYKTFLITPFFLNNLLKKYRSLKKEVGRALEELEVELKEEKIEQKGIKPAEFEKLAEEAPIIKVVAVILRHAVEGAASDIHIEPGKEKSRVRFRVGGILHSSIFLPLRVHPAVVARIKILSNLKIDETRVPQDGRFSTKVGSADIDFRVSTFPITTGEKVAIRVLNPLDGLKSFDQLGLERRNFQVVKAATQKPFGMILSTGPTGSGKTTTLYAILNLLNKEGVNIVTLEDPVEYFIEGINQSQMKPEIGYSFAQGLRQILRQDPNVIMVGEIRDEETATLAIHSALTGHIVLSTLHTNNAVGVIPRLIDMGIKPFLIAPALNIAIAQRLIGLLCPDCKKKVQADKNAQKIIMKEIESLPESMKNKIKIPSPLTIYQVQGCKRCNSRGFVGRIGVFEILVMTDSLAKIISREPEESKISEEAVRQGMITMRQDGILKVLDGVTTLEEVLRVAEEK
ncbi:MAG: GspE/PulE family protein [Patescibacteria group bacterium]